MIVPTDGKVVVLAEDCSDYFYLFQHAPQRIRETVVGRPLWSWELTIKALEQGQAPSLHPGRQAMGDPKRPDVAQATHQHGAYVDDLLLATVVSDRLNECLEIDALQEHHSIINRVREKYTQKWDWCACKAKRRRPWNLSWRNRRHGALCGAV
eukprot:4908823-Amphidinium_carterae.3